MALGQGTDPGTGGTGGTYSGAGDRNTTIGNSAGMGNSLPPMLPGESYSDYYTRIGAQGPDDSNAWYRQIGPIAGGIVGGIATGGIGAYAAYKGMQAMDNASTGGAGYGNTPQVPGASNTSTYGSGGGPGGGGAAPMYGGLGAAGEADQAQQNGTALANSFQQQGMSNLGSMYGAGANAQALGQSTSDMYNSQGYSNLGSMYGAGANVQASGQANAGNFSGIGNQNVGAMTNMGQLAGSQGYDYANAGQQDYGQQAAARLAQLAGAQQAGGYSAQNMGTAGQYGSVANKDYAAQASMMGQQNAIGQNAMGTAAGQFGQANTYGAQAGQGYGMQLGDRTSQSGYGTQGAGYGAGNMGTSNAFLGQVGANQRSMAANQAETQQSLGNLRNFYQQGPGPSAAQAQLAQSTDQNMANAISLAHSGRGAGDNAAAMRSAIFSNAATQQQAGQQMAQLRAQEAQAWRGQQLQAMGQEQQTLGNLGQQNLTAQGQNIGAAGQFAGLGYQGVGIGAQQANQVRGQDLTAMQSQLSAQQAMAGLGYQGYGLGAQQANTGRAQDLSAYGTNVGAQQAMTGLGYQGLGLNQQGTTAARQADLQAMAQNQQTGLGYANLQNQYTQQGLANQLAYNQLANQQLISADQIQQQYAQAGLQNQLGYAGLANQAQLGQSQIAANLDQAGLQNQLGYASLQNQQQTSADQLRAQILNSQLQADTARYGADRGVQVGMAQVGQQQNAANMALYGSLIAGGLSALSDVRAKEDVQPADEPNYFSKMGAAMQGKTAAKKSASWNPLTGFLGGFGGKDDDSAQTPQMPAPTSGPRDYGTNAFDASKAKPGDTFQANGATYRVVPDQPGPASFEQPISPFAQQASPLPFGQDPRLQQRTVPIDFSQYPVSDEREKEPADRLREMAIGTSEGVDLRPARAYSYRYKNPEQVGAGPGRYFGPMAQDLEKTPAGASVVGTGPDGMKRIDAPHLSLVNAAANGEAQRRLDRLEQLAGIRRAG